MKISEALWDAACVPERDLEDGCCIILGEIDKRAMRFFERFFKPRDKDPNRELEDSRAFGFWMEVYGESFKESDLGRVFALLLAREIALEEGK